MKHRILILSPSLIAPGGVERVVAALSGLFAEHHTVFECSFDPPDRQRHFESPATFVPLGASLRLPLLLRPISYLIDAFRLRRVKRMLDIDITISNLWRADLLSVLSGGKDTKISICHINIKNNPSNRLMMKLLPLVAWVYRRFDHLVTVSRPLADEIQHLYHIDEGRLSVIYNPVPPKDSPPAQRTDGRIRAVWFARSLVEKNMVVLADIFAATRKTCPALQLILVGDGPLRRELEARLAQWGLSVGQALADSDSNVIMTGFVNNPYELFSQCDLQVAPSLAEGLGMAVIEGFSASLPVIASDCHGGGLHDVLNASGHHQPGRTTAEQTGCGLLLPIPDPAKPETIEIWREHLVKLATEPSLYARLSAGARARADDFAPEVIRPQWDALFEALETS